MYDKNADSSRRKAFVWSIYIMSNVENSRFLIEYHSLLVNHSNVCVITIRIIPITITIIIIIIIINTITITIIQA